MATEPVSAVKVGSYFVGMYYPVLERQRELVHQFYNDASSMVRVDGDVTLTADTKSEIHTVIMSLKSFTAEIKTINSLLSCSGSGRDRGVLVMVSGNGSMSDHDGKRNFMQSFFLAPQEKGFFVLNDIFHFIEDELSIEDYPPQLSEIKSESLLGMSNSLPEAQVSDYELEEEAIDDVQPLNVGDALLDNYGSEREQHRHYSEQQSEMSGYGDQLLATERAGSVNNGQCINSAATDEVYEEEPQKKKNASISQVDKGQPLPSNNPNGPLVSECDDSKAPTAVQQLQQVEAPVVPETKETATQDCSGQEDDGELLQSVYVRNLPAYVTYWQLEREFKRFGKIVKGGIFIKQLRQKDIDVSYAIVEYESMDAVHAAIQASPFKLNQTQIYVEEWRANAMGGGSGRGGEAGDGDYSRQKSNGYRKPPH